LYGWDSYFSLHLSSAVFFFSLSPVIVSRERSYQGHHERHNAPCDAVPAFVVPRHDIPPVGSAYAAAYPHLPAAFQVSRRIRDK
jgi:hypothetical protein